MFALLTSGNNPNFADSKSGRKGLEPIAEAEGGEVAWSLDLHHPYDPFNSIDSLEVAARAINNIVGGASLTSSNGKPVVQPGLLSNPTNCVKYTGSAAVISRAGFPDICASPVTSGAGQAGAGGRRLQPVAGRRPVRRRPGGQHPVPERHRSGKPAGPGHPSDLARSKQHRLIGDRVRSATAAT